MSRICLDDGNQISEPTIKTWLRKLSKEYNFYCYPIVDYRALDLIPVTVIHKGESKIQISTKAFVPKCTDSLVGLNINNLEHTFIEHYLVPKKMFSEFKEQVNEQTNSPEFLETTSEFPLYNKFHTMFTRAGDFISAQETFSSSDLDDLQKYLTTTPTKVYNEMLQHILLAKVNKYTNSYKVWEMLKESIDIWNILKRKERKDSIGVKYVQDTLRNSPLLIRYKFFFEPLTKKLTKVVVVGEFDPEIVTEVLRNIGKNVLSASVWGGKQNVISLYTDIHGLTSLLQSLQGQDVENMRLYCETPP